MKFLIEFLGLEVCNDIPAKFLGVPDFFGGLTVLQKLDFRFYEGLLYTSSKTLLRSS